MADAEQLEMAPEAAVRATKATQAQLLEATLRARFGIWQDAWTLEQHSGAHRLNSRITVVREAVSSEGLDVDSRLKDFDSQAWEYRLCLKSDSLRLKRKNPKRARLNG